MGSTTAAAISGMSHHVGAGRLGLEQFGKLPRRLRQLWAASLVKKGGTLIREQWAGSPARIAARLARFFESEPLNVGVTRVGQRFEIGVQS